MARHSFIQMSKLPNVKGRISYITSHAKQENLYATYRTTDNTFWNNLARESQQEFLRSGTTGKGIEARELIIALPEIYTTFDPQQVLEEFTNKFRQQYGVECVSALHHNKRKTNYHIHLIFSERKLLPEPDIKIATRSVFYDETGKRVRTKKEITDENGQVRKGCTVIKKGEVYESHLFTTKDERFKTEAFIAEAKEVYTELINSHISDPEQRLKVFDKNSVYLPTKKIGKNNPKATEIEADNTARQEWNRTADLALVSGIEEAKILEIKQTEIHDKAGQSIRENGWLPNLFRGIVGKAKEFLQAIIREKDMPPKPVLNMDMDEFRTMQTLMLKVQKQAKAIKKIHGALQAIGYGLLVLFFAVGVMKTCGSFVEVKKPEHALKLFIRFALAKGAVTYGLELMLAVFSIVQGMVSTIITQSGSSGMSSVTLPQELIDAINNVGFWDSIPLWAVTLIGGLLITVLSFTMILTVYGRMFSLWMYAAIAPIPLSTFAGEPTSSVGKNFIRSYAGVCLQGVVIALSCIIFSAISSSPPAVDTGASVVTAVWTYVGELAFNLLVLVGAIKGCDRIVKEIMGL